MQLRDRESLFKIMSLITQTAQATATFLEEACLIELDEIFGKVLNKLNIFFSRVENSFKDFIVFERYVVCAYTSQIGYSLRNIPQDVKEKVWNLKDNLQICAFTEKECKCRKSMNFLKGRFSEKVDVLSSAGETIKESSVKLKSGMKELGKEIELLTLSAQKIMNIAEIIEIIALNAYIEAARLGEQGRGFKVIADEVRRASMKTNELASEIVNSIKTLQKRFSDQIDKQTDFDKKVSDLEKEQREFSKELNRDLLWMAQNFVDFLSYVRSSVEEDMALLSEVRTTILSVLQNIDLANQRTINTQKALIVLIKMIEEFESALTGRKDISESLSYVESLYEEFKSIPKLIEERQTVARIEGKTLTREEDTVGKRLEDLDTDVELF